MKKVFVVLSLMMFVGSMTSTAMAAVDGNKTELKKHDDKKKKKKSKKAACCAGGTAEGKTCPAGEKKSCGTEKK